jgi:polygalacturonase
MKKLSSVFVLTLLVTLAGCAADEKTPALSKTTFSVREPSFGATGDGVTKDTAAFQKALDAAAATGGGEVVVPAGKYLIGSIVMSSNTTLRLEKDAELIATQDKADYPLMDIRWEGRWRKGHRALIHAANASNIAIVGPGKITGPMKLADLRDPRGPCVFEPIECRNVRLEGFSVQYRRMWTIHLTYCDDVSIKALTIRSERDNGDGIDVDSCRDVTITGCDIDSGDDAIAIKSGRGMEAVRIARPSENIVVATCGCGTARSPAAPTASSSRAASAAAA